MAWRRRNVGDVAGNLRGMDVYKLVGYDDPGRSIPDALVNIGGDAAGTLYERCGHQSLYDLRLGIHYSLSPDSTGACSPDDRKFYGCGVPGVNRIIALACLSAIGMSIENMRAYLKNQKLGEQAADEQVDLLETQQKHLAEEARMLELRRRYVDSKIAFGRAVKSGRQEDIEAAGKRTYAIAEELKLPKVLSIDELNR